MPLRLGFDEKNREIIMAIACHNFKEIVTIDVDFPIAIPSPAGIVIGEDSLAITFVTAFALAVTNFFAIR